MIDFLMISTRSPKRGIVEIYPKFIIKKSSDLMIRGGDFYAIWLEDRGLWSTDEQDAIQIIDHELDIYAEQVKDKFDSTIKVKHLWDSESGMIDSWHKYCQKQMRDNYHMLDEKLIFSNSGTNKKDYASKRLDYALEPGNYESYDKLISTLYSEEERRKIEWAIGSIITGDSKSLQKFMVFYGAAGTGKSTILNIIQQLFNGYYSVFDAKALGNSNSTFALEAFKTNPLVAIQHDGDLSKIEDNTRLNSLVSHELMTVNEKFKSTYANRFKAFLFMGTNKPVKITDAKSGLLRRLIDVSPSGEKIPQGEYRKLVKQVSFELGAIADHCKEVYLEDPDRYDDYIPVKMMGASNDFYNFVEDSYLIFKNEDGVSLKRAYEMYKTYCEEANVLHPLSRMIFKEELKNYFNNFEDRFTSNDGERVRSYYSGFKTKKFEMTKKKIEQKNSELSKQYSLIFKEQHSIFDDYCKDCLAQYASEDEKPISKWADVKTKLMDIDTSKIHYVKIPENHIVIDFDIPDESGNKSFDLNLEAASKWPLTYAELSKSGQGIHLHYIYTGDPSKLNRIYDEHIEIKVFSGKSSLRRKLTKCNDIPIATISSGLPIKEEKVLNFDSVKSEKSLRNLIERNLKKEIHPGTKPSIDFIYKILEDAYNDGLTYDVTDMRNAIYSFAMHSTHQRDYCTALVDKMHFKSEEPASPDMSEAPIVFYDIEVFPNLFLVNWKLQGKENPVIRMINPSPEQMEDLMHFRLIGFNCRRYDNHLIYARMMGYDNEMLYKLSQRIISGDKEAFLPSAYNVSYTDIYDFASSGNKKSLKKLEIEMGIHHQELGLPWDQPVPEALWPKVAEYCDNDVIATEAAFDYLKADFTARQILAELAGMTVNDTTNTLTTKIIFGSNKKPQSSFYYRDMSKPVYDLDQDIMKFLKEACPEMMSVKHGPDKSLLPYFPGYTFDIKQRKSMYRGEEVGEGGYVYSEPGMYGNVALLDVASMHPHSTIAECHFGVQFTTAYRDIVEGRVSIKHEAWDIVNHMLDGKLTPFIQRVIDGKMTADQLADALKTAINSVYGLTSAAFSNPFRDPRNIDNIVAKRGALFMIDLKHEVQKRGFKVAHIKTDSIKIPDATPEIIQFVMDFGKKYGYTFEHEATYERMCLVNKAVYIAKGADLDKCTKMYGYLPTKQKKYANQWTATGDQFAVPYVFKTLFSHEKIEFEDMCEVFAVQKGDLYLDTNENNTQLTAEELKEFTNLMKCIQDDEAMRKYSTKHNMTVDECNERYDILEKIAADSHDYHFVGRVGQFTPIKAGHGGGVLYRMANNKYYAAAGTTGYRWLESETVRALGKEKDIDKTFYENLVNEAIKTISEFGDFEWFASDDIYVGPKFIKGKYMDCPDYPDVPPFVETSSPTKVA